MENPVLNFPSCCRTLSKVVDDITVVKSMVTDAFNHAPGQLLMNTGTMQFGRPSMGAWTLYGLGSEAKDLPAFVVFSSGKKGPSGGNSCWGSGFLPTVYQGVEFRSSGDPVLYLSNPKGVDEARAARHHRIPSSNSIKCGKMLPAILKSPRASTPSRWRFACSRAPRS